MPSKEKKRWNCLTSALRGSTRIETRSSRVSWCTADITGRRPMNSGISPYSIRSSGRQCSNTSPASRSAFASIAAAKPTPLWPMRRSITLSRFANAPAADEQHVGRVDRQELLVGVLAPALRRHRRLRALEDLQQRLLDALAGDVPRDRRVVGLAGDLVDLVDVDDPRFGLLDVVVGRLDQLQQDVLDVLADVAGLRQGGRVGDRERHVEDARERLGEQRLAAAGRAEQQDVRLLQLDVRVPGHHHLDALVVVVDGHRERALGGLLADHVLVEHLVDLPRLGQVLDVEGRRGRELLVDDLVAEIDALVADVDARARRSAS